MNYLKAVMTITAIIISSLLFGQYQDCSTAFAVYSRMVYSFPSSSSGKGLVDDLRNYSGCLDNGENNSMWFLIPIKADGILLFDIIPNTSADYDFALFKLSDTLGNNYYCSDISSGVLSNTRCNFSGVTQDTTGLRLGYSSTIATPSGFAFSAPQPVFEGEVYTLIIDKFSSASSGFMVDFSNSTALFGDTIIPYISEVSLDSNCLSSENIAVDFSKLIYCDSISTSNFSITGPGNPVITSVSSNCISRLSDSISLIVNPPLLGGEIYTLEVNQIFDLFGNEIDSTQTVSFTANYLPACTYLASAESECSCVWPGDVNYDGVVNNYDVLDLGIAYGTSGSSRNNASINWQAQESDNWPDTLYNSANFKHADCNGDGFINSLDTLAISQNYNQVHNKNTQEDLSAFDPALYFEIPEDIYVGDTINIPLILGGENSVLDTIYGVAFTIVYNSFFIENRPELRAGFSWFGNVGQDFIQFKKYHDQDSEIDVAITRIDQQNLYGKYGQIGELKVLVVDNLDGYSSGILTLAIKDVRAIDKDGNLISIRGLQRSENIKELNTSISLTEEIDISIYPNPTKKQIIVDAGQKSIQRITVTDISGKQLVSIQSLNTQKHQLNLDLEVGIYLVQVYTGSGVATKKLVVK